MRIIWGCVLMVLTIAGCSRGGSMDDPGGGGGGNNNPHVYNPQDTVPPLVEVHTPVADQVFSSGGVISVTGKVTDADGLYRGSIRITKDGSGELLKEQLYEIHGIVQYNYSLAYTAAVTAPADYTVTVLFEDHGQNTGTRTVKVKINP